jgi:hypothetical protein
VLALSLRRTAVAELGGILDAWFSEQVSDDPQDLENITHLGDMEAAASAAPAAKRGKPASQTRAKRAAKG